MGKSSGPSGVVVIDKPGGMTSHDVVARMRKRLKTRRVGHAGTLDPMATGVLVVMVGEATKLGPYLTAEDKHYQAEVTFGVDTDSLDADGEVVTRTPLPDDWAPTVAARIEAALMAERGRRAQVPPALSAIKLQGKSAHARVRAGETVELAPRPVEVRALRLVEAAGPVARLEVEVAKGYYVRSLARDLGEALGVPAHLTALRRTASGHFTLADARPLDAAGPEALLALPDAAARALPSCRLTASGVTHARCGGPMREGDFASPCPAAPAAWLGPDGALVAVGTQREGKSGHPEPQVLRGFAAPLNT